MLQIQVDGLDALIRRLQNLSKSLDEKKKEFLERLAQIGIDRATVGFAEAEYDGEKQADVSPSPVWIDENTIAVQASGKSVLFIEFGSGLIGYGHELAKQMGYGPGTWSESEEGKGHWDDPKGWYYAHGKKSFGNPPARAMYEASKDMRREMLNIAREVFGND